MILFMKVSMAHTDAAMKPIQRFDPFSTLAMVCGLLIDVLQNNKVKTVDREAADKVIRFLAERLAAVYFIYPINISRNKYYFPFMRYSLTLMSPAPALRCSCCFFYSC